MSLELIERDFRKKVCSKIRLMPEGIQRWRVLTPFQFEDGDHLAIVLKQENDRWLLSDEGHTYMHLTYDVAQRELQRGMRQKVITNALSAFHVEDRHGELVLPVENGRYGDALYSFTQALLKITDVSYLSRERARSTFLEDFRAIVTEVVPEERRTFHWHEPERDPQGKYIVDCRINGMPKPLLVFALRNDRRTRQATSALLQFERWELLFHSLGIFEDIETINRKVLASFLDVCERQFSGLSGNKQRVIRYLEAAVQG